MNSTHLTIRDAVQSEIKSLALEGIADTHVVTAKVPTDRKNILPDLPGLIISTWGNAAIVGGSNIRDDIGYQILIAMVQASNTDQTANADRAAYWSERISRKFRLQRLNGVPSVNTCRLISDVKFDRSAFFEANKDVSVIVLQFENREARG